MWTNRRRKHLSFINELATTFFSFLSDHHQLLIKATHIFGPYLPIDITTLFLHRGRRRSRRRKEEREEGDEAEEQTNGRWMKKRAFIQFYLMIRTYGWMDGWIGTWYTIWLEEKGVYCVPPRCVCAMKERMDGQTDGNV